MAKKITWNKNNDRPKTLDDVSTVVEPAIDVADEFKYYSRAQLIRQLCTERRNKERAQLWNKTLEKQNAFYAEKATTDELTGWLNRRGTDERLKRMASRAVRHKSTEVMALFSFDIDNFKSINDTYGHHTGDEVLKKVTQAIGACVRDTDLTGRKAGDELLLAVEIGKKDAIQSAKTLAKKIHSEVTRNCRTGPDNERQIAISCGVTFYDHNTHEHVSETEQRADKALYEAKQNGRNCTVYVPNESSAGKRQVLYQGGEVPLPPGTVNSRNGATPPAPK